MNGHDRLPSLNGLRAFEAVTRHLSFSAAATELNVTKAAVAQQVRLLEEELGTHLVQRSGRGLALTEAAQSALGDLRGGFDLLFRASRRMRDSVGRNRLVISSSPSFAGTWLVGRIGAFKKRHPDMDVLLDATQEMRDLLRDNVDAMIRYGGSEPAPFEKLRAFLRDPSRSTPATEKNIVKAGERVGLLTRLREKEQAGIDAYLATFPATTPHDAK